MTDVAVAHLDLLSKGGGEAVAMNAIEALQERYDVTLVTVTEPDFDALNEYFNTDVDGTALEVRLAGRMAPAIHRRYGVTYYILQNALLGRFLRRHGDEYDLLVSTINELGLPAGSIEYVHFPFDWTVSLDNRADIFHPTVEDGSLYERLCTVIAGVSRDDVRENLVFANSDWTADAFEQAYGTRPRVLYPPIDTSAFTDRPWLDRESGFVAVGRIERSKRILDLIGVIDDIREHGHDVHLHVVGPTYDPDYQERVAAKAAERDHIILEGELPRSSLVDLLSEHRYGIHGKRQEHFGMAVAEMAAAGAIPFVPQTGGQSAIVGGDARLLYASPADAAAKIDRVLSRPSLQRELRPDPAAIERRFGRERFKAEIRAAAAGAVDRPGPTRVPSRVGLEDPASVDD